MCFLWIGKIFKDYFFYRTPLVAASEIKVFNFQGFLLWSAFRLKHVALQIIYISFTSNGNLHNWNLPNGDTSYLS